MNWIKAIRPLNGVLLAAPMTLLGFRLVSHSALEGLPYALVVFIIYSATIVWNDYCDRNIDFNKGKTFAHDHAKKFLVYSVGWWLASVISACCLWKTSGLYAGLLALGLTALGVLYTQAQKNAFAKNGTVAIWGSSLLLFALTQYHIATPTFWYVFVSSSLMNYAREILKDAEDREYDDTSKGTLPKLWGTQKAAFFACFVLLLGAAIAVHGLHFAGYVIMLFCVFGSAFSFQDNYTGSVRILKVGMILFLATLFL